MNRAKLCLLSIVLFFVWGYSACAEPVSGTSSEETSEALESLKQGLEKLKRSNEKMERINSLEGQEDKIESLADQAFLLAKQEKYEEAKQALLEWEQIDPEDPRISLLRELIANLEQETDPQNKEQILMQFLNKSMNVLNEGAEQTIDKIEELNKRLEELKSQSAGNN